MSVLIESNGVYADSTDERRIVVALCRGRNAKLSETIDPAAILATINDEKRKCLLAYFNSQSVEKNADLKLPCGAAFQRRVFRRR